MALVCADPLGPGARLYEGEVLFLFTEACVQCSHSRSNCTSCPGHCTAADKRRKAGSHNPPLLHVKMRRATWSRISCWPANVPKYTDTSRAITDIHQCLRHRCLRPEQNDERVRVCLRSVCVCQSVAVCLDIFTTPRSTRLRRRRKSCLSRAPRPTIIAIIII